MQNIHSLRCSLNFLRTQSMKSLVSRLISRIFMSMLNFQKKSLLRFTLLMNLSKSMVFSQTVQFATHEQAKPYTLRLNVKTVGLKVNRGLPVEAMLMSDCVSTSLLDFLANFVLKEESQNQTFHFGLYFRVILQETHVEFEKSPIGSRISKPITFSGETAPSQKI